MKNGHCGPCGNGPNPSSTAFFSIFTSQRQTGMHPWVSRPLHYVSVVRHHSVREIYVEWRLLLGPERQVWSWNDDLGVSRSDEVELKVQPHLIKAAEWCVFKARKDEGGSRAVDFGKGRCSVKYGTTHTNMNTTESIALSEH